MFKFTKSASGRCGTLLWEHLCLVYTLSFESIYWRSLSGMQSGCLASLQAQDSISGWMRQGQLPLRPRVLKSDRPGSIISALQLDVSFKACYLSSLTLCFPSCNK